jgi:hypothetical protein
MTQAGNLTRHKCLDSLSLHYDAPAMINVAKKQYQIVLFQEKRMCLLFLMNIQDMAHQAVQYPTAFLSDGLILQSTHKPINDLYKEPVVDNFAHHCIDRYINKNIA